MILRSLLLTGALFSTVLPVQAFEFVAINTTGTLASGTFFGLVTGNDSTTTVAAGTRYTAIPPIPTTIKRICAYLTVAPGSGDSRTLTIWKNGSATSEALTISGTDTQGCRSTEVSYNGTTDTAVIAFTDSGATVDSSVIRYSLLFSSANNHDSFVCGNAGDNQITSSSTWYYTFSGSRQLTDTTEYNGELLSPTAGTWKNLTVNAVSALAVAESYVFTVRQEGPSDTSIACSITSSATTCSDFVDTLSVTAGQAMALKVVHTGIGSNRIYATWCLAFTADVAGEYIIPTSIRDNLNIAGTDYMEVWGADALYNATESNVQQAGHIPISITRIQGELNVAPGGFGSFICTLRKNAADTDMSITFGPGDTTGSDTGSTTLADHDLLAVKCAPSGGPVSGGTAHFSLLGHGRLRRIW